jgi:hypothetical protein
LKILLVNREFLAIAYLSYFTHLIAMPRQFMIMNRDLDLQKDEDNRWILDGWIEHKNFGIVGHCFAHQPDSLLIRDNQRIFKKQYEQNTDNHRYGEEIVCLIACALDALPGVKAEKTAWNSVADCCCKWDLLIEWKQENLFFPLQVKSGFRGVREAVDNETWEKSVEEIKDELEIRTDLVQTFMMSGGLIRHGKQEAKYKQQKEDLKKLEAEYSKSMPLYVWASQSEDAVRFFVREFAKVFKVVGNINDYEKSALDRYRANCIVRGPSGRKPFGLGGSLPLNPIRANPFVKGRNNPEK